MPAVEVKYQIGDTEVDLNLKIKVPSWASPKQVVIEMEQAAVEAFKKATSKPGL